MFVVERWDLQYACKEEDIYASVLIFYDQQWRLGKGQLVILQKRMVGVQERVVFIKFNFWSDSIFQELTMSICEFHELDTN
jgi:hypothetical protein